MYWTLKSVIAWAGASQLVSLAQAAETEGIRNVAIIGAGAAGASTAYHLRKYAAEEDLPINITIFERRSEVGGRSRTVDVYNSPFHPVELGASIFVDVNHILMNATRDLGLARTASSQEVDDDDTTAFWDGENIVLTIDGKDPSWWLAGKLLWRYGRSPYLAQQLMKKTVNKFLELYHSPMFPFRSLTQRAYELGLADITGITGEQFLSDNKIGQSFSQDLIQAATRVNYASNLRYIHGLETMVSIAAEGSHAVVGGNWQIFAKMIENSGATLHRSTDVTTVSAVKGGDPGAAVRYSLTTKATASTGSTEEASAYAIDFDSVVIATPWQYASIEAGDDVVRQTIDEIPYMRLHVTLFTSPFTLHPKFFGMKPGDKPPRSILTTLKKDETPHPGPDGVGSPGVYSISALRVLINPETKKKEYLYKIFSAEEISASYLSKLLGTRVPDDIVSEEKATGITPITWHHAHVFNSYPIELPRVTFQDPVVGNGVYYTSGIESFISTMETSALMGMNVARLVADDLTGPSGAKAPVDGEAHEVTPDEL